MEKRSPITPEIRVFIAALRNGKNEDQAFEQYCWAKSAVPINEQDLRDTGDPEHCPPQRGLLASAWAAKAFRAGKSDAEIAREFREGLRADYERPGILWRPMLKSEQPTHGQLLRSLTPDGLMTAGRLLGYGRVAEAFTSR